MAPPPFAAIVPLPSAAHEDPAESNRRQADSARDAQMLEAILCEVRTMSLNVNEKILPAGAALDAEGEKLKTQLSKKEAEFNELEKQLRESMDELKAKESEKDKLVQEMNSEVFTRQRLEDENNKRYEDAERRALDMQEKIRLLLSSKSAAEASKERAEENARVLEGQNVQLKSELVQVGEKLSRACEQLERQREDAERHREAEQELRDLRCRVAVLEDHLRDAQRDAQEKQQDAEQHYQHAEEAKQYGDRMKQERDEIEQQLHGWYNKYLELQRVDGYNQKELQESRKRLFAEERKLRQLEMDQDYVSHVMAGQHRRWTRQILQEEDFHIENDRLHHELLKRKEV